MPEEMLALTNSNPKHLESQGESDPPKVTQLTSSRAKKGVQMVCCKLEGTVSSFVASTTLSPLIAWPGGSVVRRLMFLKAHKYNSLFIHGPTERNDEFLKEKRKIPREVRSRREQSRQPRILT